MIPSVVADEVAGALRDFLATGFGPSNPALAHVIDDFRRAGPTGRIVRLRHDERDRPA